MYLSFNEAFLFSSQGQFPVLKKVMPFLTAILPPVMAFYDLAGVLPLVFLLYSPLLSPACPETALHGYSTLYPTQGKLMEMRTIKDN